MLVKATRNSGSFRMSNLLCLAFPVFFSAFWVVLEVLFNYMSKFGIKRGFDLSAVSFLIFILIVGYLFFVAFGLLKVGGAGRSGALICCFVSLFFAGATFASRERAVLFGDKVFFALNKNDLVARSRSIPLVDGVALLQAGAIGNFYKMFLYSPHIKISPGALALSDIKALGDQFEPFLSCDVDAVMLSEEFYLMSAAC